MPTPVELTDEMVTATLRRSAAAPNQSPSMLDEILLALGPGPWCGLLRRYRFAGR